MPKGRKRMGRPSETCETDRDNLVPRQGLSSPQDRDSSWCGPLGEWFWRQLLARSLILVNTLSLLNCLKSWPEGNCFTFFFFFFCLRISFHAYWKCVTGHPRNIMGKGACAYVQALFVLRSSRSRICSLEDLALI